VTFAHVPVQDGFELRFGKARINILETPGHTPESICLLVTDDENPAKPWAVLTGDTLFLGDVGRPDLSRTHSPEQLAGMLYDSLHDKLLKLPDQVLVYPAHGAGSLCGRNMRAERSSTIGTERLTNYALQIPGREEFVKQLTSNLPVRPDYFLQDAEINRGGAPPLSDLAELTAVSPADLKAMLEDDVIALDIRPPEQFAAGHVPGSVNIALSGQFATWAGTILGLSSRPVLIVDSPDQLAEARLRLARVGIEAERGYLEGGVGGWKDAGFDLAQLSEINVNDVHQQLSKDKIRVLDVRREPEWMAAHIDGADWWPLDRFRVSPPEVDLTQPLAVHCQSGYRSMIACSLLQRAGFKNVVNVSGGFSAWQEAQLPVATGTPVETH
jgi:hydroxyacylglutathione hydrolase